MRRALLWVLPLIACGDSATAPAPRTGELRLVSGNPQSTTAGYLLPDTIVVSLRDDNDAAIPFATMHASTDAVLGDVTLVDALTRADGTARVVWRLGLTVGAQQLRITTGADAEVAPLIVSAEARSQPMRAIAGDERVLCGLDATGQLGCWQPLKQVDHAPHWTPHATAERFVALALHPRATGERHGCAASVTGRVWCFNVAEDAAIGPLSELAGHHAAVVQLSTGADAPTDDPPFCGLTADGTALCWGNNTHGTLGDGTLMSRAEVMPVATAIRFSRIAVGAYHACATALDGVGWCWGRNHLSQVGLLASEDAATIPVRRTGLLRFNDVVPVPGHATCGVLVQNGGVYCWGAKEATGIGAIVMDLIVEPSFAFPVYTTGTGRDNSLVAVDLATVVIGSDGESAWWGRLEPGVEQVYTPTPLTFLHQLPLTGRATSHVSGLVCGTSEGSLAYLCGRMMTLAGYPSHQLHPEFSGFGMPQP